MFIHNLLIFSLIQYHFLLYYNHHAKITLLINYKICETRKKEIKTVEFNLYKLNTK